MFKRIEILGRSWRALVSHIIPALILIYGLWTFPLAIFGPDRDRIPGDLGDARFNNYILEHFHKYSTGQLENYWDAPFMYPYKNVIALSDNLLGTAPIYSLFRRLDYNRESAFQFWIVALFALNYLCCYWALWRWSDRPLLAAGGAFIFAFGIHMIGHMEHAQVFPKFMIPIAFLYCWKWLRSGRILHLTLLSLAVVYQFYCGIYLGFMLCYALLFLMVSYLIIEHRMIWNERAKMWQPYVASATVVLGAGALLLPLMLPYMEVSSTMGMRKFEEVIATIPRPISYFFTHPGALSWRTLSLHSEYAFDVWWSHFHFMGAVPWLAIVLLPIVLWKYRSEPMRNQGIAAVGLAFVLSTVFCLRIGDFTLYKLIFEIPGFSAMRAMDRIIEVQVMFFSLITVLVFASLGRKEWHKMAIAIAIPLLIIQENKLDITKFRSFNKYDAKGLVDRIVIDMNAQVESPGKAIAYIPVSCVMSETMRIVGTSQVHLNSMLAGQQIGVPVVNGYVDRYPSGFLALLNRLDLNGLDTWCSFNQISTRDITVANNIKQPFLATDTIRMFLPDNHELIVDPSGKLHSRNDHGPSLSSVFVRVSLVNDRFAYLGYNGNFLSAALHKEGELMATTNMLGDMGQFKEQQLANGKTNLIANNGKYLIMDTLGHVLAAQGVELNHAVEILIRPVSP